MNRRTFLQGAGAVSVLVVGGSVLRACDRGVFAVGEGPAFAPWHDWRSAASSGPLRLVQAGILAASPHNSQPWLFRVSADCIELFADAGRQLGALDPYRREMHLGLGCAIENMRLAGLAEGYASTITLARGPLAGGAAPALFAPVATLLLAPGTRHGGALYEAIPHRHTNRAAYDARRPLPPRLAAAMQQLAAPDADAVRLVLLTSAASQQAFRAATLHATEAIIADRQMIADSDLWFRGTQRANLLHRDGVTLEGAGLSPLVLRLAKFLPKASDKSSDETWLKNTRQVHLAPAGAFGYLLVPNAYDRTTALRAGQLWQRLHLWATTQGLAMQPLNQVLERIDRERQLAQPPRTAERLREQLAQPGWVPTFAFRVGYPLHEALAVPRRPVPAVLLPPLAMDDAPLASTV